jgi:hypothetical protein
MPLKSGIICLKIFKMKSLWIQTIRICSILWQLMFWIDTKFNRCCPCLDSNLSSYIVLGTNKGNLMHYPVNCTSHLRKEMQPTSNMWCHFQAWTFFISGIVDNSWWYNPFLSNSWKFERHFYYWHPRPIKELSSSLSFFHWSCQV